MNAHIFALVNDKPAPALYAFTEGGRTRHIFTQRQLERVQAEFPETVITPLAQPPQGLVDYLARSGIHRTDDIPAAIVRWEAGYGVDPLRF